VRQRRLSLQELAAAQLGRALAQNPLEEIGAGKSVLEEPRLREAFNEGHQDERTNMMGNEMTGDGITYNELWSRSCQLQAECKSASATVDSWLIKRHDQAHPQAVPAMMKVKMAGELDARWLVRQLGVGNNMGLQYWIAMWDEDNHLYPDEDPIAGGQVDPDWAAAAARPRYHADHVFKRVADQLQIREQDEVAPGRTVTVGDRIVQGPETIKSAAFVRYLRANWPARADEILNYLKGRYEERLKYDKRRLVWRQNGANGREYTLSEKLELVRMLGGLP